MSGSDSIFILECVFHNYAYAETQMADGRAITSTLWWGNEAIQGPETSEDLIRRILNNFLIGCSCCRIASLEGWILSVETLQDSRTL